VTEQYKLLPT